MPVVLEDSSAAGSAQRLALGDGGARIPAQPGARYRLVDDTGAPLPGGAQIRRIGDDLVVDGLPEGRSLALEGFFTRCAPDNPCELSLENLGGAASDAITPATRPVAALSDGSFLMHASGTLAQAAPVAPEAETSYKPWLALLGGLAIVGAGGGGGASASSTDTTPPEAPTILVGAFTSKAQPLFTGTAEPGATLTLTVFADSPATWQTRVDADGSWRIDTAVDSPSFGFPVTLVEGVPVQYSIVATDNAGNRSAVTTGSLTLDSLALSAPIITSPLLTGDTTPVIRGTAEPGATVTVAVDLDRDGIADATWITTAADSGAWSVDLETAPASGSLPGGQLAQGSSTFVTATASDGAGNTSLSTVVTLRVDTGLPPAPTIGVVAGDDAVNALEARSAITVAGTLPEADRPVAVTWGATTLAATVSGTSWTATFSPSQIPPDGAGPVSATYVSGAGAESAEATRDVLIDRAAPLAPAIAAVPENADGGISASELPGGALARIDLTGTGAAAGDRIVLQVGGSVLAIHTISGTEIGGNVATIEIPPDGLASLGDGSFALVARVVDFAGNEGATSPAYTITIDTTAPARRLTAAAVIDDAPPDRGEVPDGGATNDRSPTLSLTLDAVLDSGDTLRIYRASGDGDAVLVGVATLEGQRTYEFTDSQLPRGGTYTYTAELVDAAGNAAPLTLSYTILVT